MKLWKLKANSWVGWEENQGFVIRAGSERRAREIAMSKSWNDSMWLDDKQTSCVELTVDGDEEVILIDNTGS